MNIFKNMLLALFALVYGYANPASASLSSHPIAHALSQNVSYSGSSVVLRLDHSYQLWHGVKYKFGGTTADGIDCSSYIQHVFSEEFSVELPRTTTEQINEGRPVSQAEHHPGDLVFFNTGAGKHHVGVLINSHEFIHASSSHGVTISDLNRSYWQTRYMASRRLIESTDIG